MTSSPPLSAGTRRETSPANHLSFSGAFGPFSPHISATRFGERANSGDSVEDEAKPTWRSGEKMKFPLHRKTDPWKECQEMVKRYDRALCKGWTEEITNLLILSGLFSAVVTAFAVESYQWLQPSSQDLSYLALIHLSTQLSADPSNSTLRAPFVPPSFDPAGWQVHVNIVWFLSLVLSVTTAMIGILVLQWLREYERSPNLSPKEALALRQMLHEGLKNWHVPKILYALPLLLQTALVLFFVGLLILLWNINREVAGVAGAFLAVTLVFIALTTVMPTLQFLVPMNKQLRVAQCPYKSLQSWAFFRLISTLTWLLSARIIPLGVRIVEKLVKRYAPPSPPSSSSSSTTSSDTDPENPHRFRLRRQLTIPKEIQGTVDYMKKWYLSWWRYEDKMWKIPSWEGFDQYWRSVRNEPDSETTSDGGASASAHYDTIRGLQWVNRKLPLGVDATYVIHPCLLDLEVEAAVHALRVLSRTPGDNEKDTPSPSGKMDSLDWLIHFHRRTSKRTTSPLPHNPESDPLHRDILSLLAVRHLNNDESILHPDVRNYYLEMFIRIRNAGDDVHGFFERPLRHVEGDEGIYNLSEGGYVQKMFELFEFSMPDEMMLQILGMILRDARSARGENDVRSPAVAVGTPVGQGITIDPTGEPVKPVHERLKENWKLMQMVWKVLVRLLKHPRSLGSASSVQSATLDCAFQILDEMLLYIPLLRQYGTRHFDELLGGLCVLYESAGDTAFETLRAYFAFDKLRALAQCVSSYLVGVDSRDDTDRRKWKGGIEGKYLRMDSVFVGEAWDVLGGVKAGVKAGVGEGGGENGDVSVGVRTGHDARGGGGHRAEATDDTVVEGDTG